MKELIGAALNGTPFLVFHAALFVALSQAEAGNVQQPVQNISVETPDPYGFWMLLVTLFIAAAAVWSAQAASRAAKATAEAAKATAKASEAQILFSFLGEYASKQMHDDLKLLGELDESDLQLLIEKAKESRLDENIDEARRHVNLHFKCSWQLYGEGLMSEGSLRLITRAPGYALLFNVVKPLTEAIDLPTEPSNRFEWYDQLIRLCPLPSSEEA